MEVIKKVYDKKIYIPDNIKSFLKDKRTVFFDIETTGLNPEYAKIILIGASYEEDEKYVVEQFFAESLEEEGAIIKEFIKVLQKFDVVVTYNGKNFDVPFVNKRIEKYSIDYFVKHEHLDMICYIRPNKQVLGLSSCSLKSVEKFLNIGRDDTINGGDSIDLYYQYLRTKDENIKGKILLHNYEDVFNLPGILKVFENIEYKDYSSRITSKQKSFLSSLVKRNNYTLKKDISTLTKEEASSIIDYILNGKACDHEKYIEQA